MTYAMNLDNAVFSDLTCDEMLDVAGGSNLSSATGGLYMGLGTTMMGASIALVECPPAAITVAACGALLAGTGWLVAAFGK